MGVFSERREEKSFQAKENVCLITEVSNSQCLQGITTIPDGWSIGGTGHRKKLGVEKEQGMDWGGETSDDPDG